MAATFLTKTALFNLCRAFPRRRAPPPSLTSGRNISRVCFTSAVSPSEGRDPVENARDSRADLAYEAKKWREEEVDGKASDTSSDETSDDEARATVREGVEKASDYTQAAKDKANEGASKAADKAYETKERAKEKAEDTKERAKEYAEVTKDRAKEKADEARERAKEYGHDAKERAEETAQGLKETIKNTAHNVGEKTKETVKGAWKTTKTAARKMTEAAVGPDEGADVEKGVEDLTRKAREDWKEDDFKKR